MKSRRSTKYKNYSRRKYKVPTWPVKKVQSTDIIREEWAFELWVTYQADEKRDCAQDAQEGIEGRHQWQRTKEYLSPCNERQLTVKGTAASRLMATKTATKLEPTNQTELNEPSRTISTTLTQNHLKQANLVAPVKRRMYEGDVCNEVRKRASKVQKGNHFQLTYLNSYPISKPNWNRCQRWSRRRRI